MIYTFSVYKLYISISKNHISMKIVKKEKKNKSKKTRLIEKINRLFKY